MWTTLHLLGLEQRPGSIACYQMSGLFARREFAGPDGVRYARSKHIGGISDASVIFGITRVSTDWFFHLLRPASLVAIRRAPVCPSEPVVDHAGTLSGGRL